MDASLASQGLVTGPITHVLVRTRFHGGGIVSRHRTTAAAERAVEAYCRSTTCSCGCVVVVPLDDYATLPLNSDDGSPYAAVRR